MDQGPAEFAPPILISYCLVAGSGFIVGTIAGWLLSSL